MDEFNSEFNVGDLVYYKSAGPLFSVGMIVSMEKELKVLWILFKPVITSPIVCCYRDLSALRLFAVLRKA